MRQNGYRRTSVSVTVFIENHKETRLMSVGSLTKIVETGSRLKILPFLWDTEQGLVAGDPRHRMYVNLNLGLILGYVATRLVFLAASRDKGDKLWTTILGSLFLVLFVLGFLLHANNVFNLMPIVSTVNTYCGRIREHYGELFQTKESIVLVELLWRVYMLVLHVLLFAIFPFLARKGGGFECGGNKLGGALFMLFLLLDLYALYGLAVIVGFYAFLIVDCAAVVERLSKNMTQRLMGVNSLCLSSARLTELRDLSRAQSEIQLGFVGYRTVMEPLVLPLFIFLATLCSSAGLFTVIKFFGELGLFFSAVLSLGESVAIAFTSRGLSAAANISDKVELLQKQLCALQLVPRRNRAELRVLLNNIRPLQFRIGAFFPVSKETATDFMETLCSVLTTLLMAYG